MSQQVKTHVPMEEAMASDPALRLVRQLYEVSIDLMQALHTNQPVLPVLVKLREGLALLRTQQKRVKKGDQLNVDPKRDYRPLWKWLSGRGVPTEQLAGVQVQWDALLGHHLVAAKAAEAEQTLLEIPVGTDDAPVYMTLRTALQSKAALLLHNDEFLQRVSSCALSVHLLIERQQLHSQWAPYVNSLPRTFTSSLYWGDDEVAALEEGSQLAREVAVQYSTAVRTYTYIYMRLATAPPLEHAVIKRLVFTWDNWRWATTATESRRNSEIPIKVDAETTRPTISLVPLFDLTTHATSAEEVNAVAHFDVQRQVLVLTAERALKAGDVIRVNYGPRTNDKLLAYQGFILNDVEASGTMVQFGLREGDPLRDKKEAILVAHELGPVVGFMLSKGELMPRLLSFLRIMVATEDELSGAPRAFKNEPLTHANEVRALTMLLVRLKQLRQGYTLTRDEHLAKAKESTGVVRDVHTVMAHEAAILESIVAAAEAKKEVAARKANKKKEKAGNGAK